MKPLSRRPPGGECPNRLKSDFLSINEYTYTASKQIRIRKDRLEGVLFRIFGGNVGGTPVVRTYAIPTGFDKKMAWKSKASAPGASAVAARTAPVVSKQSAYGEAMDYRYGRNGKPKDIAKAFELFELSAKHGTPKSYYWIGEIYERGLEVEKDMPKAIVYYEKSFDAGWSSGASGIGEILLKGGPGLAKDEALALEWLGKGAALEDKNCLRHLAWFYGANKVAAKRDGKKAANYADRMMATGVTYFLYTGSAAAAYAENCQFDKAVEIQKEIVAYINKQYAGEKYVKYRGNFQRNLERFQRGEALPTKN